MDIQAASDLQSEFGSRLLRRNDILGNRFVFSGEIADLPLQAPHLDRTDSSGFPAGCSFPGQPLSARLPTTCISWKTSRSATAGCGLLGAPSGRISGPEKRGRPRKKVWALRKSDSERA